MFSIRWVEPRSGPAPADPFKARPPRRRTCLNGKLVYSDGALTLANAFTLDCGIHDISEGGAKITLSQCQPLPGSLYLIIAKFCVAYRAELVWMKYPSRGLRFCKKYNLEEALPEDIKFLHKLWGDIRDGGIQRTMALLALTNIRMHPGHATRGNASIDAIA